MSVETLINVAQQKKIPFQKACNRLMTLKITQGHQHCRHSIGHVSLPISNSLLVTTCLSCTVSEIDYYHHFSRTVYITACDFHKSSGQFRKDNWNYKPRTLSDSCG